VRGKEAAWPVSKGENRDGGAVPPAARDVLDRIVRLGCRTLGADEIVVLVRDGRDTHKLLPIARSCADHDGRRAPTGPALDRAMSTGAPAAGDTGHVVRAAAPIMWSGGVHGAITASGGGPARRFDRGELDALAELAELAGVVLEEAEQRARLVRAVDMRDSSTGRHSESVGQLARRVGERLGMTSPELWLLELGARLHDVGKIGVPDAILNKAGPLDADEWEAMRRHAELGAQMVEKVPGLEPVAPLVRSHHERWDGRGYPDGLRRDAIPLASRVISACDAFQAMTSERPYRPALDVDAALAELTASAGSQFDPAVVLAIRRERSLEVAAPVAARTHR
jgi:hypothetical protein